MNRSFLPVRLARPFDADQLAALLEVASEFDRVFELEGGDVHEADFWKAFVWARHDTGLLPSQILALDWRMIGVDGRIPLDVRLSRRGLFALSSIASPERPLLFTLPNLPTFDFAGRWKMIRSFAADMTGGVQ